MAAAIEVRGLNGEWLVFDGASIAKFRHEGKAESARNPVSTYREVQVKPRTKLFGKAKVPPEYDVLLACATIFSLSITEDAKPDLDRFIAAIEAARG